MPNRLLGRRSLSAVLAITVPSIAFSIACATSTGNQFPNGVSGNGSSSGDNTGIGGFSTSGGNISLNMSTGGMANADARPARCNSMGNCQCFNVASIGHGGVTGAQSGSGGMDNTTAFVAFLNGNSSAAVDTFTTRSSFTFNNDFLAKYDVIIVQWLSDSRTVNPTGGFLGGSYWTFTSDELAAVKTWVQNGGGMIFLTGYDANITGEVGAVNPLLAAVSDMSYNADDVLGAVEMGNGALCLGDSQPLPNWSLQPPIGAGISFIGAFHGHSIKAGSNAVIDNQDPVTDAVYAAHENLGNGSVFAYCDEWVTYSSQWDPVPEPATYCLPEAGLPSLSDPTSAKLASCMGGQACPAVQTAYQTAQFWANGLAYASRATACPVQVQGVTPR